MINIRKYIQDNITKILNGMSIGIIVSLMPEAVFGQLVKALNITALTPFLSITTSLMGAIIGICIATKKDYDMITGATLAVTTFIAAGAMKGINPEGMIQIKGAGDIINCSIGAFIGMCIIDLLKDNLKAYKLILLPAITIVATSIITSITAAPISMISVGIGNIINEFTTMQPFIMSILIAVAFAIIIVSPISTVAIALLISLSNTGSAAATLGVASMGLTMGFLSYKENGFGTSMAHYMGSAKIQLENVIKNPKIMIPGIVTAIICSISVPIFHITGTPASAGFGLTGLVGPLGHLSSVGFTPKNIEITIFTFVVIPVIVAFISSRIFRDKLHIVTSEEFKVDIK